MKISIVIPNYNGKDLLVKNLPNILSSGALEVIVGDDGSSDKSVEFLREVELKNPGLRILIHKKNQGFIPTVNELFYKAKGELVVLLNSDVFVEKDFLNPLMKHFDNPKVFAVNLHEKGEGPSRAFWKNGFYEFGRGEEKNAIQKSAWASGGSAIYSKEIWLKLKGFDPIFAPFYWEDVDLSFRALKAGYEILWDPSSKVFHEHATTIKKNFSKKYVDFIKERNRLLFIWKNISDRKLIQEHKVSNLNKLFSSEFGYWIPFVWALLRSKNRKDKLVEVLSDEEAINYAGG